jgi:hypothetical protein
MKKAIKFISGLQIIMSVVMIVYGFLYLFEVLEVKHVDMALYSWCIAMLSFVDAIRK